MKNTPFSPHILFTQTGYQALFDEKKELIAKRPGAVSALSDARNMGDLSENGYYKAARAKLSYIDSRLRHLEKLIRFGKIVEPHAADSAGFGSTVTLKDTGGIYEFTIVGKYESDPNKHTISYLSPIGKALLGKRTGDIITVSTPKGVHTYTLTSVRYVSHTL